MDNDPTNLEILSLSEHSKIHMTGNLNNSAKITDEIALKIFKDNDSHKRIALKYGMSQRAIWDIKSKRTWKHIHEKYSCPLGN